MTEYQVVLCIIGGGCVIGVAAAVRSSLRTRTTYLGVPPFGQTVQKSQSPALFWTNIVAQVVGAAVVVAAIVIAIFRLAR